MKTSRILSALSLSFLAIVFMAFSGCKSPLAHSGQDGASSETILLLDIGGQDAASRSVLPAAPTFTSYVLAFTPNAGQDPILPMTVSATTVPVPLSPGSWTITVTGRATFNGTPDVAIAEGSATVNVIAGTTTNASIAISPTMAGANGTLRFSLSVPQGINATAYEFSYRVYVPQSWTPSTTVTGDVDTSSAFSLLGGPISVAPGFYAATMRLTSSDSIAVKTEIVHVYSNMESTAAYNFLPSDVVPMISLSGTLSVDINGAPETDLHFWQVDAFTDPGNTYDTTLNSVYCDASGNWTMKVPLLGSPTSVYFRARGYSMSLERNLVESFSTPTIVNASSVGGIALSADFSYINLSGSLSVTINGTPEDVQGWYVYAFTDPDNPYNELGYSYVEASDGLWSMAIEALSASTPVYFRINGTASSGNAFQAWVPGSWNVQDTDVSGIVLTCATNQITLSGSLSANRNGVSQSPSSLAVYAYTDPDDTYGSQLGTDYADVTGAWSFGIDTLAASTTVYFRVSGLISGQYVYKDEIATATVYQSDVSGISLSYNCVDLSGHLSVTLDGLAQDLTECSVYACLDPNQYFNTGIGSTNDVSSGGEWSMLVEGFSSNTQVYFHITGTDTEDAFYSLPVNGSWTVRNTAVSGIALSININHITLSGTISATMNGQPLALDGSYSLAAYTDPDDIEGSAIGSAPISSGAWTMELAAFPASTTLYFCLVSYPDQIYECDQTVQVQASDVSGIALTCTMASNMAGTFTGFPSAPFGIYAIDSAWDGSGGSATEHMLGSNLGCSGNTWALSVPEADLGTNLYFIVVTGSMASPVLYRSNSTTFIPTMGISDLELDFENFSPWTP